MILYLIKSGTCLLLLLLIYKGLLEQEKMHRFNRYFLLLSLIFSLTVPLLTIEIDTPTISNYQLSNQLDRIINQPTAHVLPPAPTEGNPTIDKLQAKPDIPFLLIGYLIVASVLLIRFLHSLYLLFLKISRNTHVSFKKTTLILVDDSGIPYSFYTYIFVDKNLYQSGKIKKAILNHELTHVLQKHSLDILFIELLKIVFWFNPALYFYKKAMQLNHEFLADESVVAHSQNVLGYQRLLLKIQSSEMNMPLASSIHYSITKKRLIMMTKKSIRLRTTLKQLVLIPLLVTFLFAFANKNTRQKNAEKTSQMVNPKKAIRPLPFINLADTTKYERIGKKYADQARRYHNITPSPENKGQLKRSYQKLTRLHDKGVGIYKKLKKDKKNVRPMMPLLMTPVDRMQVYYRQHPNAVKKDTTILNRVAKEYTCLLRQYSQISPTSEGNLKYVYKKLAIYYNNWYRIFKETEGVSKLAPLPQKPKKRMGAYSKKNTAKLQQLSQQYNKRIGEYLAIKPIQGNKEKMEATLKKINVLYGKWSELERSKKDVRKIPPPPQRATARIKAYNQQ